MGILVDFLLRALAVVVLLIAILGAARGIWWLVRPLTQGMWFDRASPVGQVRSVQVRPFDVIKGSDLQKGKVEGLARLLAAKIRRLDEILTADLRDLESAPGVRVDSVIRAEHKLQSSVSSRLDIEEFRPFNLDVVGILNFVSGLLYRGYILQGSMMISDKGTEIIADARYMGSEARTSFGPWSVRVSKNAVFGLNFLPGFWTCQYRL